MITQSHLMIIIVIPISGLTSVDDSIYYTALLPLQMHLGILRLFHFMFVSVALL